MKRTKTGVFEEFWRQGLFAHDTPKDIDLTWLGLDGVLTKAPLGGKKPSPIRRITPKAASKGVS